MRSLESFFESKDWPAAHAFIAENNLEETLLAVIEPLSDYDLTLEVSDCGEGIEHTKLYLNAYSGIENVDEVVDTQEDIFNEHFLPRFDEYKGKIIFSMD